MENNDKVEDADLAGMSQDWLVAEVMRFLRSRIVLASSKTLGASSGKAGSGCGSTTMAKIYAGLY
jgi:hypothetical protein